MPIEVTLATPEEHAEFVGSMPEFDRIAGAVACTIIPSATLVNFELRDCVVGGACYVPGTSIDSRAAILHLFGILPERRPENLDKPALSTLEEKMAQEGVIIALLEPFNKKSAHWFNKQGYWPVPYTAYFGKSLLTYL